MNANYWNDKADWLKAVRTGWFNEDYIEFLVEKVWKIQKPVNVIDFGCGYGYGDVAHYLAQLLQGDRPCGKLEPSYLS